MNQPNPQPQPHRTAAAAADASNLRALIESRLDLHWPEFAARHPRLAAAIERTSLVEMTVDDLAAETAVRQALDAAARDQAMLVAAGRVVDLVDAAIRRLLGMAL